MATALMGSAVGSASAHPGADDTIAQNAGPCAELRQARQNDQGVRAAGPTAAGQIDAVLIAATNRAPIAGGKIVLTGIDACGDSIHRHMSTSVNGQVSFRGLQPGRYRLTAYRNSSATRSVTKADIDLPTPSLKTIQFTAD
ncbi:carboxypeptidase-like regulatory domain-containing protein [Nocardia alba]|uniref:carboxypeptidase-like regulatory domain-containing protein n=1 Tax=Nocardia alba TaxID=225051 RepID=UPI0010442138|nr:carboxypeptidase-like regulatory domain-containing protein [Nocardia alba]